MKQETLEERLQREAENKLDLQFRYGLQKQVYTNFDDCTPEVRNLLKQIVSHTIAETIKAGVGAIVGKIMPVELEEPFVPFYKPDGMSEEEYASEIHRMEQERAMWQAGNEHNKAITTAATALQGLQ